ncbi:MAG: YceI family protein [Bacteroidota bacterium]
MKRTSFFLFLFAIATTLFAQKPLITRTGTTIFFSHSPIEDIEAINHQSTAAIDLAKREVVVKMLIKHFEFEKSLMQEHFNENYLESEKYPSAIFKGVFTSETPIDLNKEGTYPVTVTGKLTMHGVTQEISCQGQLVVAGNQLTAKTEFMVRPEDFDIKIPSIVVQNIAEEVKVTSILPFNISN